MNPDPEFDPALQWPACVALDHAVLHVDCTADGIDDAAKLHKDAVAGTLHDATVVQCDGGLDQVAPQRPQPRKCLIFVRTGEPAVTDYVGGQDCRDFSALRHGAPCAI